MRLAAVEAYRIWSATYDTAPNPLLELEAEALPEYLTPLEGKRLVDVGCGTGRWMEYATRRGAHVIGIDAVQEMLLRAAGRPGLKGGLVRGDAAQLPLPSGITDLVLCSFTIAYLPSLQGAAAEMARVARPGARILVTDLHPDAVAAGWTRSFRQAGQVYDVDHRSYREGELIDAFTLMGLKLEHSASLHFGEPQREVFRRAGREHAFDDVCRTPAVWITSWRKP